MNDLLFCAFWLRVWSFRGDNLLKKKKKTMQEQAPLIHYLHIFNVQHKDTLYNIGRSYLKEGLIKKSVLGTFLIPPFYLAENCNLKGRLRQGHFLLYRPMLSIQQWIYTLNEMEGKEMLKSPSKEVLSTGA